MNHDYEPLFLLWILEDERAVRPSKKADRETNVTVFWFALTAMVAAAAAILISEII